MLKKMKKFLTVTTLALGFASAAHSQGLIYLDGTSNTSTSPTATSNGRVFFETGTSPSLDTSSDVNVELAYGTSASNVSLANAVCNLLLSSSQTVGNGSLGETLAAQGDIGSMGNGQLFDASGTAYQFPTIPVGTKVYFEVFAWTGNYSSYTAAQASSIALVGASGVFSEYLVSSAASANNIQGMPALVLSHPVVPVPEPGVMSSVALGGLALLGLHNKFRPKTSPQ